MFRPIEPRVPDEVRTARPRPSLPTRQMLGRAIFTIVVVVGVMGLALFLFTNNSSPCTDKQLAGWNSVDHFVPLSPQDGDVPGCSAAFDTDANATAVLDHYGAELDDAGWTITKRNDPVAGFQPTLPLSSQVALDFIPAASGSLEAVRDGSQMSVVDQTGWTAGPNGAGFKLVGHVYIVLANE